MKVYVTSAGEYSDYRITNVFRNREDAEAYVRDHGDESAVEEYELREGPVERRNWYTYYWNADQPDHGRDGIRMGNPWEYGPDARDFDGDPRHVRHHWTRPPAGHANVLRIEGWDRDRVLKVYSEQRAQELARREGVS